LAVGDQESLDNLKTVQHSVAGRFVRLCQVMAAFLQNIYYVDILKPFIKLLILP
jgi:hypothetical protein